MKTKILMGLVCFLASMSITKIEAQFTLGNGEYFNFAGNYEYEDDIAGLFKLFIWGTEGEFEAELEYKSDIFPSYKIGCTVVYEPAADKYGNYLLYISYDKLISGNFLQKGEFEVKKAESAEEAIVFTIAIVGSTSEITTVTGSLDISGYDKTKSVARTTIFHKLASEGDEGPP